MIAHLRGTLLTKSPGSCILECAGVGYEVAISIPTYSALPEPIPPSDAQRASQSHALTPKASLPAPQVPAKASLAPPQVVALHIYTQVREDTLALYGFLELPEKRLFERLITVSGVGPRLALTILSGLSASQTITAIRAQDHATLTRIPGVGKRLAERLAVELKEKLDDLAHGPAPAGPSAVTAPAHDDALSALLNLGYPRSAVQKALDTALTRDPSAGDHFDTLFRAALQHIR